MKQHISLARYRFPRFHVLQAVEILVVLPLICVRWLIKVGGEKKIVARMTNNMNAEQMQREMGCFEKSFWPFGV